MSMSSASVEVDVEDDDVDTLTCDEGDILSQIPLRHPYLDPWKKPAETRTRVLRVRVL